MAPRIVLPQSNEQFQDATAIVFKHSNACDLSEERLEIAEEVVGESPVPLMIVPVQQQRKLSDELAMRFGIRHASPQAIVLNAGRVVDVRSHWGITRAWLEEMIATLQAPMPQAAKEPA